MTPSPAFTSSASQRGVCDACGAGFTIRFEQQAFADRLRWAWSAKCDSCGKGTCDEGAGRSPGQIRAAILGAEGEWSLAFRDPGAVAIATIKALRGVYNLGLKESKDQWEAAVASGAGLRGTHAECEAIALRLREDRVEVTVVFAGAAPPPEKTSAPQSGTGTWAVTISGGTEVAISTIKSIRAAFDLGLKEAKDLWDARGPNREIRGSRLQCETLSSKLRDEGVAHEVRGDGSEPLILPEPPTLTPLESASCVVQISGRTSAIVVIKAIRAATGLGLKESKDLWDKYGASGNFPGTRTQCDALAAQLRAEGVAHLVRPA